METKNHAKEPALEEYGLTVNSYEDYRIQKNHLEKLLTNYVITYSGIGLLITIIAFFVGLFSQSGIVVICGLVIGGIITFVENNKEKEIIKKRNEIYTKIELIKDKVDKFEKDCKEYYLNCLEDFFQNNLYKKRSGSDKFEQSLTEFASMIDEVKEINKKLIFTDIQSSHQSYLFSRQVDHSYQKDKKFKSFDNINYQNQSNNDSFLAQNNQPSVVIPETQEPPKMKNFWDFNDENTRAEINKATNPNYIDSIAPVAKKEVIEIAPLEKLYRTPRKIDWEKLNKTKAITGLKGEEIVIELEKDYLKSINRLDLAEKVKHVSKEIGDGLGYDVLSYFSDGKEKYIEVKSTIQSRGNSFYLSRNELDFLKRNKHQAHIYRLFNVNSNNEETFLSVHLAEDILSFNEITPIQYVVKIG